MSSLKQKVVALITVLSLSVGVPAYAADWDSEIAQQEAKLQQMYDRKKQEESENLKEDVKTLKHQVSQLAEFDARAAYDALAKQLNLMQDMLNKQMELYERMMSEMNIGRQAQVAAEEAATRELEERRARIAAEREARAAQYNGDDPSRYSVGAGGAYDSPLVPTGLGGPVYESDEDYFRSSPNTRAFLVNPGPSREVSYTQDSINSQGNSTMVFRYAPNQMYKIYCRPGFLTDMAFKKGEQITYCGGGDNSAWTISDTVVDGVPHIYIKPLVDSNTTNLIVNTTKHSYHILLNTSQDWYNPMVRWNYDNERNSENMIQRDNDNKISLGNVDRTTVDSLNFNYSISGPGSDSIARVFDDGKKTWIQFRGRPNDTLPPLFIRKRGNKALQMVTYRIKENYYMVDLVFDVAELHLTESDVLRIKRNNK